MRPVAAASLLGMSSPAPVAAGPDAAASRPVAGATRWLRGAMVGVVASTVSVGGHVLGAGSAPGLLPLAGLTSAAVLVAVALSGVRWRLTSLLALLLGAQVVFHVAFAAAHGHPAAPGHTAHLTGPGGVSGRMLALHLVAAVVTAVLLRRGRGRLLAARVRGRPAGAGRPAAGGDSGRAAAPAARRRPPRRTVDGVAAAGRHRASPRAAGTARQLTSPPHPTAP